MRELVGSKGPDVSGVLVVRWNVLAGAAALILALQTSPGVAPSPSSTPKTIIRTKTSPFCQTFRDNVFYAIEGLRINDRVLDEGHSLLSTWPTTASLTPAVALRWRAFQRSRD